MIGISLLLGSAIYRLGAIALEIETHLLTGFQWFLLIFSILFMAYSEGYKGFQLKFSPRFAARCLYLKNNPRLLHSLLAPLFCMGFFYATRRRKIASALLTLTIISFIVLARLMPQPWRGILDAGVVIGLAWGLISVLVCLYQVLKQPPPIEVAELPNH